MPREDLKLAVAELTDAATSLTPYLDYYEGRQPLRYASDRLENIFRDRLNYAFVANWCELIADAVYDRLEIESLATDSDTATDQLQTWWGRSGMELEAESITRWALVYGEAMAIVWPGEDGAPVCHYNDPRNTRVFYAADDPRRKSHAVKWWSEPDGTRLNLYYADRIEKYRAPRKDTRSWQRFELLPDEGVIENPYGEVPVFHFTTRRPAGRSEIHSAIPFQDSINKLFADMMVAAEYGAFPQRYVISEMDFQNGELRNGPGNIWPFPPGTSVGQFSSSDLRNYMDAMAHLANDCAAITRTPRHYLNPQGGDPSGEALKTAESALIKKVKERQAMFGATWSDLLSFVLRVLGIDEPVYPRVVWEAPEFSQEYTEGQTDALYAQMGVPLEVLLERRGWTSEELQRLREVQQEQQVQRADLGAALLQSFNAGQ